jgi:hypothetical protein
MDNFKMQHGMVRGGQNPPDPINPLRPDPGGFCTFFHGYGLKFPKSARIGSGLGLNKKNICGYPIRPVSTRHSTYLEQTLEVSEKYFRFRAAVPHPVTLLIFY